jgi:hypothetical protein
MYKARLQHAFTRLLDYNVKSLAAQEKDMAELLEDAAAKHLVCL